MSDQTTIPENQHRIRSGEVYTTSDISTALHVSRKTVAWWYRLGLEFTPVSPHPKAKRFVMGDALIEFLRCYGVALRMLSLMGEGGEDDPEEEEGEISKTTTTLGRAV